MNEEFKRLKKWVEMCPVEAAMRIDELEQVVYGLQETLRQEQQLCKRYEKALFDTYVEGMTMKEILKNCDKWAKE